MKENKGEKKEQKTGQKEKKEQKMSQKRKIAENEPKREKSTRTKEEIFFLKRIHVLVCLQV